jgi:hypothetical protein
MSSKITFGKWKMFLRKKGSKIHPKKRYEFRKLSVVKKSLTKNLLEVLLLRIQIGKDNFIPNSPVLKLED